MINSFRSAFTWKDHPWRPDPIYTIPPGYPPVRPKPLVFNETWDMEATNVATRALNV